MSLILEALRKSEAERRRGQVPGLHVELPPAAQSARSRRAPWPWLVALAVLAITAATWLLRDGEAPAPSAGAPSPTSTERAASADMDRTVAADIETPAVDAATSATEPLDIATPPADATPVAESPTAAAVDPTPAPAPRQQPEPVASTAPNRDPVRGRATAPVAPAPVTVPAPRPNRPATTPALNAAADPTATTGGDPALLRLSDLAAAERRALPPLQVSMHMWAPTSARRFAIIDGARVNEGDRLGDAVVDEITRDGVVLAWHGRRVHIPIH
ncbi:MAG: general secretion pathway protein GspB [Lysobacter sp.]